MKKRYTINVAGYRMNVISDDAPEDIQEAVAALDRSVRTFCTRSRSLPLTEAAMLAGLDACAEKRRAQKRVRELEHELYDENGEVARMRRELAEIKKAILEMAEEDAAGTDAPAGNGEENEGNGSDEGGEAGEKDADAENPDADCPGGPSPADDPEERQREGCFDAPEEDDAPDGTEDDGGLASGIIGTDDARLGQLRLDF